VDLVGTAKGRRVARTAGAFQALSFTGRISVHFPCRGLSYEGISRGLGLTSSAGLCNATPPQRKRKASQPCIHKWKSCGGAILEIVGYCERRGGLLRTLKVGYSFADCPNMMVHFMGLFSLCHCQ
jgi:hypothetical protein